MRTHDASGNFLRVKSRISLLKCPTSIKATHIAEKRCQKAKKGASYGLLLLRIAHASRCENHHRKTVC